MLYESGTRGLCILSYSCITLAKADASDFKTGKRNLIFVDQK